MYRQEENPPTQDDGADDIAALRARLTTPLERVGGGYAQRYGPPGAQAVPHRSIRIGMGRQALIAGTLVFALLAAMIVWRQWSHRPAAVVTLDSLQTTTATDTTAKEETAEIRTSTPDQPRAPAGDMVVVHVAGAVKDPGVVQLPVDSRVHEAIEAAGGATRKSDPGRINLARLVTDGEQIYVPKRGEQSLTGGEEGASPDLLVPPGAPAGKLNINTATAAQFETLPGIGPVLAARIVEHRNTAGRFANPDDLQSVSGIGPAIMGQIKDLVTT